jgi:hypothetical protein
MLEVVGGRVALRAGAAAVVAVIVTVGGLGQQAAFAVPVNDNFANATPLIGQSGSTTGSNVGGSVEDGEPNNADVVGGASVWFNWTAPSDGFYVFKTAGSSFDTTLGIYTGDSIDFLVEVGGSNDVKPGIDTSSAAGLFATNGVAYHISVDGVAGATGSIALAWLLATPPGNNFANAVTIQEFQASIAWTNTGATAQSGEPAFLTGGKTVWFKLTAADEGWITFDTDASFDTLLGIYTGSAVDNLTVVGQNDDVSAPDHTSSVSFLTTVGTVYYIAVDGKGGATGNFDLNWSFGIPPVLVTSFTPANGASVRGAAVAVSADVTAPAGLQQVTFTVDDGSTIFPVFQTTAPFGFTLDSTLLPDGAHTINVMATDITSTSTTVSHAVTVDNTNPVAPHFTKGFASPFTTATSAAMSFAGTDATSGIGTYKVQYERANFNAAGFTAWATAPGAGALTKTSYTMTGLAAGYDYCFRVVSSDKAGNVSAPSTPICVARLIDDKSLAHSAGWTQKAATGYYANTYSRAVSANRTLTLANFHGDRLAVMAYRCPTCGSFRIYVGTALIKSVSLVSTTKRDTLIVLPPFGQKAGTVKILTLSTKPDIIDAVGASRT